MNKIPQKVKVSAPGKIILSGEHAVVYGKPAILSAINRRLTIEICGKKNNGDFDLGKLSGFSMDFIVNELTKKIDGISDVKVRSNIPVGSGMGSSAAFAVALVASVGKFVNNEWDTEKINRLAYLFEKKHHGNPSGGDNTVCTFGKFLWYRKELEEYKIFNPISVLKKTPPLFVIDTGRPMESTKEMVQIVGNRYKNSHTKTDLVFERIEEITKYFLKFLLTGKGDIAKLIRANQRLLKELGVVSNSTQDIVKRIEAIGGSAKVSGAGGKKGASGILLVYHDDPEKLFAFADKSGLIIHKINLGEEGARIEKTN